MIEFIIIAILQGLFEWLPISSSGQVMIISTEFFGISTDEAFSLAIWLHLGTALAVIIRFWKDYVGIFKSFMTNKARRMLIGIEMEKRQHEERLLFLENERQRIEKEADFTQI